MPQPLLRVFAAAGLYRLYMNHQRRLHTLVSNVHGPGPAAHLRRRPDRGRHPVSVGEAGNLTVTFVALSYAGTLTVTIIADPDRVPDLPVLTAALQTELDALTTPPAHL